MILPKVDLGHDSNFMRRKHLLLVSTYSFTQLQPGANVHGPHRLEYNIQGSLAEKVVAIQVTAGVVNGFPNLCAKDMAKDYSWGCLTW